MVAFTGGASGCPGLPRYPCRAVAAVAGGRTVVKVPSAQVIVMRFTGAARSMVTVAGGPVGPVGCGVLASPGKLSSVPVACAVR